MAAASAAPEISVRSRVASSVEYFRSQLWVAPLLALMAALGLAATTLYIEKTSDARYFGKVITRDPDTAREVLGAIATAMLTLTALVFTITIVALQLASSQYSPRLMRTFLRDRQSKFTLALFLATFAYALFILRSVTSVGGRDFVPGVSIGVAYVLVAASLVTFVAYISHIARSIRVSSIIARVVGETRALIHELSAASPKKPTEPAPPRSPADARTVTWPGAGGILRYVDEARLVDAARRNDCLIELVPRLGDFVPVASPVFLVHGADHELDSALVCGSLSLGAERTMQQDVPFGLRQLVDIGARALSSSLNDPTTAVRTIDGLHDLLRELLLATGEPPELLRDEDGVPRLIVPRLSFDAFLTLAVTEIRIYGASSPQITRRLEAMLADLADVAAPRWQACIARERDLLARTIAANYDDIERPLASAADMQGLGTDGAQPVELRH